MPWTSEIGYNPFVSVNGTIAEHISPLGTHTVIKVEKVKEPVIEQPIIEEPVVEEIIAAEPVIENEAVVEEEAEVIEPAVTTVEEIVEK